MTQPTNKSRLAQWVSSAKSIQFNNHKITYWQAGEGEALLLIHGFPTASWDWHCLWPELTGRWECAAPDMLGFGYSGKPRRHNYTIMEQADVHVELVRQLGWKRCHVFAHDYGDTVAQELLARHNEGSLPFGIDSMCFLNGGLFPEMHRARPIQKLLNSPIGFVFSALSSRRMFDKNFSSVFAEQTRPDRQELEEFWEIASRDGGMKISYLLIRYIRDRLQHRERWVNALVEAKIPLKLIDGVDDPVSGGHLVDYYRQLVPHSDITALEGVGHYPHTEAPELVLNAYLQFRDVS